MNAKLLVRLATIAVAVCLATALGYTASADFYLKITGSRQGVFKGEGASAQQGNRIPASKFSLRVTTPRDAQSGMASGRTAAGREAGSGMATGRTTAAREAGSGMATGKRQHGSITIVKEWGPASPMIARAASTGEVLTSVVMEFVRPSPRGGEEVYKTLVLTDALISSLQKLPGGTKPMEEITFNFEKIEFKSRDGKTMAMDDWTATK